MSFTENFETAKALAKEAAQTAAQKAKELAAIAKANISIYAEEDKIKKAEVELGKLYYRDYAVGEEMDAAEYLPWCQKIDESKALIAELKDRIDAMRAGETPCDEADIFVDEPAEEAAPAEAAAPAAAPTEEAPAEEAPAEETPAEEG